MAMAVVPKDRAAFVEWHRGGVLALALDYQPGDELVDLFPGSGAVSHHASFSTPQLWDSLEAAP